jgi:hypothetical protein
MRGEQNLISDFGDHGYQPIPGRSSPIDTLIITHKFLETLVERIAKAEITRGLLNTTWLVTMVHKSVPKDMGNDKIDTLLKGEHIHEPA